MAVPEEYPRANLGSATIEARCWHIWGTHRLYLPPPCQPGSSSVCPCAGCVLPRQELAWESVATFSPKSPGSAAQARGARRVRCLMGERLAGFFPL